MTPKAQVVLVHGTGTASDNDEGPGWWQRGSPFATRLEKSLQGLVGFPDPLFHWSGRNRESARQEAAEDLFGRLVAFEQAGQPYHLVGHSHGGSVILGALMHAHRRGVALQELRSIVSVGTPFLRFARQRFTTLLVFAAAICIAGSLLGARHVLGLLVHRQELLRDHAYGSFVWLPVLFMALLAMVGWTLLALGTAIRARWTARRDQRALSEVGHRHGRRWLVLSSRHDEAINGLARTQTLSTPLVPRLAGRLSAMGWLSWIGRPMVALYDRWLARVVDDFVWDTLQRYLQGNDRPGFAFVGADRVPGEGWQLVSLSNETEIAIEGQANACAGRTIGKLRSALGMSSFAEGSAPVPVLGLATELSWGELVHTTYFESPEIQQKIVAHIRAWQEGSIPSGGGASEASACPPETASPRSSTYGAAACAALFTVFLAAGSQAVFESQVGPYAALKVPKGFSSFVSRPYGIAFAYPNEAALQSQEAVVDVADVVLGRIGSSVRVIEVQSSTERRRLSVATDDPSRNREQLLAVSQAAFARRVGGSPTARADIVLGRLVGKRFEWTSPTESVGTDPVESSPSGDLAGEKSRHWTRQIQQMVAFPDLDRQETLRFILTTTEVTRDQDVSNFNQLVESAVTRPGTWSRLGLQASPLRPAREEAEQLIAQGLLATQNLGGGVIALNASLEACGEKYGLWRTSGTGVHLTEKGAKIFSRIEQLNGTIRVWFRPVPSGKPRVLFISDPRDTPGTVNPTEQWVYFETSSAPPPDAQPCFSLSQTPPQAAHLVKANGEWSLVGVQP
jgi:hypothetical protein